MKYGELTLGQVEALVNKLGGLEGAQRFLRGEPSIKSTAKTFPSWKTLKLGTGINAAQDFRKASKASIFRIDAWAKDVLSKPAFWMRTKEEEVELVAVTVKDLGFENHCASREKIYTRATELGLELCPSDVGPLLRVLCGHKQIGHPFGCLLIGMEPIPDSYGNFDVFRVADANHFDSCNDIWLASGHDRYAYSDKIQNEDTIWIFLQNKS